MRSNARLAQSVERETLNLKVAGSTPASGSNPDALHTKHGHDLFFLDFLVLQPIDHRCLQKRLALFAQTDSFFLVQKLSFRFPLLNQNESRTVWV